MTAHHQTGGRDVPALPTFTFSTGITVRIRRVSPLLAMEIRKAFPPPKPPMQETELGPQPNTAHPDYEAAMEQYQVDLETKVRAISIRRGVEVEIDHEALKQLREDMREIGVELDPDDKLAYITGICIGSSQDYNDMLLTIQGASQPSEEAIQAMVASFPGHVQGARPLYLSRAALWAALQPAPGVEPCGAVVAAAAGDVPATPA